MIWKKEMEDLPTETCPVWIIWRVDAIKGNNGRFFQEERKIAPATFLRDDKGYKFMWIYDENSICEIVDSVRSNGIEIECWCEMEVPEIE